MVELGARSIGISGADDGMLRANIRDPELGLVGDIVNVNTDPINAALESGYIPIIAPVGVKPGEAGRSAPTLLNINADTAAGEIAAALGASRLVFLTDVQGVLDTTRRLIPRLTERQARGLISSNVAAGGMIPKLEACLTALHSGGVSHIIDGREPSALVSGKTMSFQAQIWAHELGKGRQILWPVTIRTEAVEWVEMAMTTLPWSFTSSSDR